MRFGSEWSVTNQYQTGHQAPRRLSRQVKTRQAGIVNTVLCIIQTANVSLQWLAQSPYSSHQFPEDGRLCSESVGRSPAMTSEQEDRPGPGEEEEGEGAMSGMVESVVRISER